VRLYLNSSHYSTINSKFSWSQNFSLAYLIEDNPYIANQYLVGGVNEIIRNQVPFVGLNESEVKTGSIVSGQLGLQYKLTKKAFITARYNMALYDIHGVDYSDWSKDNLLTGYGLSFSLNSAIGPLEFTVMQCDQDAKVRTHVNIGFGF
jgi:NTE family protein